MTINTERLAYWYFRLNGFVGNESYIVLRGRNNSNHATDIDYLGVRFPHRKELYENKNNWMKDDENSKLFKYLPKGKLFICLAEIKQGTPYFNDSWTNESLKTLEQLLLSLGCISIRNIPKVVKQLHKKGFCNIYKNYISFVAVGDSNTSEKIPYNRIPIISWEEILFFIYNRFKDYKLEKSNLNEWSNFSEAKQLKEAAMKFNSFIEFKDNINISAEPLSQLN